MGLSSGGMPSVLPKAPCRSCIFPIEPNMCAFSRKRLCIFTQTFASVVSNVCIGGFKRLHWWFQTFASAVSNVCVQIGQKSGMGVCPSFWPDRCRGGMLFPVPLIPTSLQQNSSLLLICCARSQEGAAEGLSESSWYHLGMWPGLCLQFRPIPAGSFLLDQDGTSFAYIDA